MNGKEPKYTFSPQLEINQDIRNNSNLQDIINYSYQRDGVLPQITELNTSKIKNLSPRTDGKYFL